MSSPAAKPDRLLSLDVMRGGTILAMILVNNPGDWGALFWPLGHAEWHGWTPTDLIFPFFLFMVGVAMAYSFAKYTTGDDRPTAAVWGRIARRVVVLILLGLLLNSSGKLWGFALGYAETIDLSTLRWPGVLQRIALAYLGASILVLLVERRLLILIGIGLLAAYALWLKLAPPATPPELRLEPQSNIVLCIDEAAIGRDHMWTGAVTDPEGLLSTVPAIVTALIGYAVGRFLKANPLSAGLIGKLLLGGALLTALGLVWDAGPHPGWGMPINKALWTPSFVLLTGGLATITLAACLLLFDIYGKESTPLRRVATAFQMVGVNAIFVFVASGLVARLLTTVRVGETTLKGWIYQNLVIAPIQAIGVSDPRIESVAFAAGFVACWWLVLWAMWRRGWSIRV